MRRNHSLVKAQDISKNKDLVKIQSLSLTHTHKTFATSDKKESIERNSELKQILIPQEYTERSPPEKRVFLGSEASLRLQPPSRRELDWDLSVSVGLWPHTKLTKGQHLTFVCCMKQTVPQTHLQFDFYKLKYSIILTTLNSPTKSLKCHQLAIKNARTSLDGWEDLEGWRQSRALGTRSSCPAYKWMKGFPPTHLESYSSSRYGTSRSDHSPLGWQGLGTQNLCLFFLQRKTTKMCHQCFWYGAGVVQGTKEREQNSFIPLHAAKVGKASSQNLIMF